MVASFAGDTNYVAAANATGDLVVSQAATTLGSVSGTASFGGDATLTATLTSSVTNAGASGETVSFTLDGTSVGTAVTNSSGVATLTTSTRPRMQSARTQAAWSPASPATRTMSRPRMPLATWSSARRRPPWAASRERPPVVEQRR